MTSKRLVVTSALPYANGHIHLGHLVEYTQTDIFVRHLRMVGREVLYFCADDTHGTAIMIRARQEKRSEEEVIGDMSIAHQRDFAGFHIRFDHYGSTHSKANRDFCNEIWGALGKKGLVSTREVTQLFDPKEGVFLADRFVRGKCPNCKSIDQYGDSCEKCGATYEAIDLIDPKSTLSGATPEVRNAPHVFVSIEPSRGFLTQWTQCPGHLQPEIANFLTGQFLGEPLRDWDVSRPAPYFGFEIPDAPGNYWYVWFDAPVGYIAATREWCDANGRSFDDYWRSPDTEIIHVIGKDIVRFHTLFWPAILHSAGFNLPSRVQVHGFLTVNGEKMSKRKGTFILGSTYLAHLDPSYLRYFYASKLSSRVDDIDLSFEEMVQKVNSDLVNKVVNLASRSAKFASKSGLAASYPDDGGLFANGAKEGDEISAAYSEFDFAKAMRLTMALADRANEYVDRSAPWALAKQSGKESEVQAIVTVALNLFRQIALYLAPVLPKLAEDSGKLLGCSMDRWDASRSPWLGTPVGTYEHLMKRVDEAAIQKLIEESKEADPVVQGADDASSDDPVADDGAELVAEPLAAECTVDDFAKVDLRVARIIAAEGIPEAKKLLKLTVSLGGDDRRTVLAGIKAYYKPEELVGRLVVVCANLAPRKMKFGTSEGMVVAAGGGDAVFVLSPDSGAKPGMRIH